VIPCAPSRTLPAEHVIIWHKGRSPPPEFDHKGRLDSFCATFSCGIPSEEDSETSIRKQSDAGFRCVGNCGLGISLVQIRFLEDEEGLIPREKPQVPPLRYASVGMTILLRDQLLFRSFYSSLYRIVIPTEAYPDFLLRAARHVHGCGSPWGFFVRRGWDFGVHHIHHSPGHALLYLPYALDEKCYPLARSVPFRRLGFGNSSQLIGLVDR
jgi:hypothetical protein